MVYCSVAWNTLLRTISDLGSVVFSKSQPPCGLKSVSRCAMRGRIANCILSSHIQILACLDTTFSLITYRSPTHLRPDDASRLVLRELIA